MLRFRYPALRHFNADTPRRLIFDVPVTAGNQPATDINQVIIDALLIQIRRHAIGSVAFGDAREIGKYIPEATRLHPLGIHLDCIEPNRGHALA